MQTSTLPPAVLAEMHSACEAEPALLNSERIEKQFGSCGIAVLSSEAGLRRSSVYSVHGEEQVCRTYAIVSFAEQHEEWYREEHAKILAGNSIGAVFRSHGWDVHKQTLYIGSLPSPDRRAAVCELMRLGETGDLALHVYQLLLAREAQVFEYATIIEAHHPDYLSESALHDLYEYNEATALSPGTVSEITALVLVAGA
ncbi:MAG: hypothetical protein WBN07_06230 [Woeseiaceae bacterium]